MKTRGSLDSNDRRASAKWAVAAHQPTSARLERWGVDMKNTLVPGIAATRSLTVDRARTIDFLGEELRVYATPELVRDFEMTCRELLLEHCDPGEDSVGTGLSITHSGASLLGMSVELRVEVAEVNGRMVKFTVSARDGVEAISAGEHTRAVVEVEKLRARVRAKAAKAAARTAGARQ
jgi:fluoroacetyl-CoA thioesterase